MTWLCGSRILEVKISTRVCDTLAPLLLDTTNSESLDLIKASLEKASGGKAGSHEFNDTVNFHVIKVIPIKLSCRVLETYKSETRVRSF